MPQLAQAFRPRPADHGIRFLSSFVPGNPRSAAQAIDALRRGWPVALIGAVGTITLLAVESATDSDLAAFDGSERSDLLISGERAATLRLTNQLAAASPGPVLVARGTAAGLAEATAIADPALDLAMPMKGPFSTLALPDEATARAALTLLLHAGLLPAAFLRQGTTADAVTTSPEAVAAYGDASALHIAARAQLPVAASASGEITAFRSPADPHEHVALTLGARDGSVPIVRLHSECLTGDVLGSLKCDCGPQLDLALHRIADAPWGILLYLRQEGRGIGLINKLRAYQLQDQGFDTVEANLRLGFPVETRNFAIAAQMLKLMNVPAVRLMTNNPDKVARLEAQGIKVVERLPHSLPTNPHNERYLAVKRDRTGHKL